MNSEFDYVVVGGGTAGAIVARRLAELRAGTVCLVEAGPSDEGDQRVLVLRDCDLLLGSDLDYCYKVAPQERSNSDIVHNRARVLGGCSSHNAAACFRPPSFDLRRWVELGAQGWGPEDCEPFVKRVFERLNMEYPEPANRCDLAFLEAAQQAGFPLRLFGRDEVTGDCVGWFLLHKRGRLRTSSSTAYLHPLGQLPPDLRVCTGVRALRIVFDESRGAKGVETTDGMFGVRRELIVSCGAIDSPRLLLLSGVGPADQLRAVGVTPMADLPGVGQHLLDHPETVVNWESAQPVPSDSSQFWQCGLFSRTRAHHAVPDLEAVFTTSPYDELTKRRGFPTVEPGAGFAFAPHVTRSKVEGRVALRSGNADDAPWIDPRYYSDDGEDEATLIAGIRVARHLAEMPALKPWVRRELSPGASLRSDFELGEYVRSTTNTSHHLSGTCAMGAVCDRQSVVDDELRVHGVGNLRIVDASVFPSDVGVNPVVTVMMIAEKAAWHIGRPVSRSNRAQVAATD
jgi:choline oxidase